MVNPYTSRTARLTRTSDTKKKYATRSGDRQKRGNGGQVEGLKPGKKFHRVRGLAQTGDKIHGQVIVS